MMAERTVKVTRRQLPINIRPMRVDGDREAQFVLATWKRTARRAPVYEWIPSDVYKRDVCPLIEQLVSTKDVLVCVNANNNDQYFGWVCYGPGTLFYIYVKDGFRKIGLATLLFRAALGNVAPVHCAFWNQLAAAFAQRCQLVYNPYRIKEINT